MCMSAYYASRQRQFSAGRHYRLSAGGCCDDPAVAGGGPLQPDEIHVSLMLQWDPSAVVVLGCGFNTFT